VTGSTTTPLSGRTVATPTALGESQRFVEGGRVNSQWWQEFGSAELNALIEEALQASPTLAAAQATLRQAQELYAARFGSTLYPQADANIGGQRQRTNPSAFGQAGDACEFSLYNAGVGVRCTFDLAGGNRLGPTLPGFLSANVAKVLIEKFNIKPVRQVKTDIEAMMAGE
jgi:outer membrane protein TolC